MTGNIFILSASSFSTISGSLPAVFHYIIVISFRIYFKNLYDFFFKYVQKSWVFFTDL